MTLPQWKNLKPQEKTQRGLYELIKKELDGKMSANKKVEIKDEPFTIKTSKKEE